MQKVSFFLAGGGMKCIKFAHGREGCSCYISFTSETTEQVLTDFVCWRLHNMFVSEFNL